jgi:Domain of unknown function (DUF1707)
MSARPDSRAPELIRIGDRERADAADRLAGHAAAGRLTLEELEQRLESVQAALFARDLDAVEADLPAPARRTEPPQRPPLPAIATAVLLAALVAGVHVGHPFLPLFVAAFVVWRAPAGGGRRVASAGSAVPRR